MDYAPKAGKYAGRCCDCCDDDIIAFDPIRYDEESSKIMHAHCWRAIRAHTAEQMVLAAQTVRASASTADAYDLLMLRARQHALEAIQR